MYLFKTPHHKRFLRDWKVEAWKVATATSAAPSYFPICKHVDRIRLVDGGVWANNPIMVGIIEAVSIFNVPIENIRVLSLGTSFSRKQWGSGLDWGGKLVWAKSAAELVMRGQSVGAVIQAELLLGKKNVLRLNPVVPDGLFSLDKFTRTNELVASAADESRKRMPKVEQQFLSHTAAPYVPIYSSTEPPRPERSSEESGGPMAREISKRIQLDEVLGYIADSLDIPKELYQEAGEEYEHLGEWLGADHMSRYRSGAQIYPQGSIRLGTAVCPINEDEDFDIDLVYLREIQKESVTQEQFKNEVG